MKPGRLLEIWKQPVTISEKETEVLETFTKDYPYFNLPYIILAKVYKDKQDFRYEDMMRQAALRSKDRKSLYAYLHQDDFSETSAQKTEESIALSEPSVPENVEATVITNTEEATQVVEVDKEVNDNPDKLLVESEDNSVEEPEAQPVELSITTESVSPELEEVITAVEVEKVVIEDAAISTVENDELTTEESEIILLEKETQSEETEKLSVYEEEIVEPKLHVKPRPETKPKSEAHTFDEWLNMFSQKESDPFNTVVTDTEKPKTESKPKPVFKPKNKSNAPEAIALIEKFIEDKPSISKPKSTFFKAENAAKKSLEMDLSIATETLAKLFVKQGHPEKAIEIYQKLMLKFPKKERYFADLIEKLTLNNE